MKRRTVLQGAGAAVAISAARGFGKVSGAQMGPILVGTGCPHCRPDLYPLGTHNDVPVDANHSRADWLDWKAMGNVRPTITVNGVVMHGVTELYRGANGWIIQNTPKPGTVAGSTHSYQLCPCRGDSVLQSLFRGRVETTDMIEIPAHILRESARISKRRAAILDAVWAFHDHEPHWADTMMGNWQHARNLIPVFKAGPVYRLWSEGPEGELYGIPRLDWVPLPGSRRDQAIDDLLMNHREFEREYYATFADHPGEIPTLEREALTDWEATFVANDGYKHKVPGPLHLVWRAQ